MQAFPRLTSQQAELGKIVLTTAVLTIVFAEIYALFAAAARTPGFINGCLDRIFSMWLW